MNLWCYGFACDERPGDLSTNTGRLLTVVAALVANCGVAPAGHHGLLTKDVAVLGFPSLTGYQGQPRGWLEVAVSVSRVLAAARAVMKLRAACAR